MKSQPFRHVAPLVSALVTLAFPIFFTTLPAMEIVSEPWGTTKNGEAVTLHTLRNANGMEVKITNYGGIIVSLTAPDHEGNFANVVLGYDTFSQYEANNPFFGCITGRYANRIAKGRFTLQGTEYQLDTNNTPNHLHGGKVGFDKKIWAVTPDLNEEQGNGLILSYTSPDGEEGYPGDLNCKVTYRLRPDNTLSIVYHATTNKPTVLNLTNHTYFNLAGQGNGDILNHELTLFASRYTPTDETQIPTGQIADVKGTPLDFTTPHPVGARINDQHTDLIIGLGYDHNFILDDAAPLKQAARLSDPKSGRVLHVRTTQPAVQLYSGNHLGKNGVPHPHRSGLCLETQAYPDSPNQPAFPTTILLPGETYEQVTEFQFTAKTP